MSKSLRPWWKNCRALDDKRFLNDRELRAIDALEDSISPLDDQTVAIRQLITRFEACYHKADKQGELIVKAIGTGRCPKESKTRPPKRKKELQNSRRILSRWCKNPTIKGMNLDVGGIPADELVGFIGKPTPLKVWQVERIVDKVSQALDLNRPYHSDCVANQAIFGFQYWFVATIVLRMVSSFLMAATTATIFVLPRAISPR